MPLSDHEQKMLDEIERQFYEQDPKFARGVATGSLPRSIRKNFRRGLALVVLGFLVLVTFFLKTNVVVGVVAFLLMLAGAWLAFQSLKKLGATESGDSGVSRWFASVEGRLKNMRRREDNR